MNKEYLQSIKSLLELHPKGTHAFIIEDGLPSKGGYALTSESLKDIVSTIEKAVEVIRFYSTIKQHDEYDDALNEKAREFLKQWEGDK